MIGLSNIVAVTVGVALVAVSGLGWQGLRRESRMVDITRKITRSHARLLSVKRKQLVAHDGYGNYELQPWIDHVNYFIDSVVLREARRSGLAIDNIVEGTPARRRIIKAILQTLDAADSAADAPVVDADILSGEHYEALCRNLLQANGWRVETTPMTGDQGADLIAEARGLRVVIQCKFYSKPVGNKAVQEACAAAGFHGGDYAVVVSNAKFTRSARQLAHTNDVLLLHHDQLADLGRLLRATDARA